MKDYKGLSSEQVLEMRRKYSSNVLTPPKRDPWWKLYLEKFSDPIIQILCVAAVASLVIGFIENQFLEPIGIIVAILLATTIGFINEFQAAKKFDILNKVSDDTLVKVYRNGVLTEVPRKDLVFNDVIVLEAGEEIPADCTIYESMGLKVNESTLTGESKSVRKGHDAEDGTYEATKLLKGTVVEEGNCTAFIIAVGDKTEFGKTARQAAEITDTETPLNQQLNRLGALINKIAFISAGILIVALLVKYFLIDEAYVNKDTLMVINNCLGFVMIAVALIVVAVPEGLPMAVTLALAYSMKKMAKTNNLVRKMHACETIGAATMILTDKTGTLTENRMKVVNPIVGPAVNKELLAINIFVNSTANLGKDDEVIGNPTEGAILKYAVEKLNADYLDYRREYDIVKQIPFNSTNKYMHTIVKYGDDYVGLLKGAPNVVANACAFTGNTEEAILQEQAKGRRVLSYAYKVGTLEEVQELTNYQLQVAYAIEDPIRREVPAAMAEATKAGIKVKIVTGDNQLTATEIARQAGLGARPACMTGSVADMPVSQLENMDVFARTKPEDKQTLVKKFQEQGHIVAMTGDGTNDAPALNHAHVGLAMGNGTAVAKEAADIILLDNSFPSIINAVKWGRSLYKNIQHFILFQLTINVVAILTAIVGPFIGVNLPFTVTQMLWVNLIMDTFAALALATEPANEAVMSEKPRDPKSFIIDRSMWGGIMGYGLVFFGLIIYLLVSNTVNLTEFFTIFVMLQWWNLFNARVFEQRRSIFDGITQNPAFFGIALLILVGQILIVQFGGEMFRTEPLSLDQWLKIVGITSIVAVSRELWYQVSRIWKG